MWQVVGTEALERILGKRPFHSEEMRNIDKFRDGFMGSVAAGAPADSTAPGRGSAPAAEAAPSPAAAASAQQAAAADRPSIPRDSVIAS